MVILMGWDDTVRPRNRWVSKPTEGLTVSTKKNKISKNTLRMWIDRAISISTAHRKRFRCGFIEKVDGLANFRLLRQKKKRNTQL
jgi:hypothetical protein